MRRLTIKREKSFVGCAAKMQIYIEDASSDELTMTVEDGNTPRQVSCRKLGELKNGEEATFEIAEDAVKLFVIADQLSKDYCNDCYQLPEGSEDISLSGRNKFNPAVGNAFRFNGNDGKVAVVARQRGMKRGAIVLILFIVIGFLAGYGISAGIFAIVDMQEKEFYTEDMTITLNQGFDSYRVNGYYAAFASKDVEILVIKQNFDGFSSILSVEDFARAIIMTDPDISCEIISEGGQTYYEFTIPLDNGELYRYTVYNYKTDDAYWQVYFATPEKKANKYTDDVRKWARSIEFK